MPAVGPLTTFIAKTKAKASEVNANFQAFKTLLEITKLDQANIQNLAIITALLADDAVTADKLRDDAVTDGNRAVTTNHIRDDSVDANKLRDDATVDANRAVTTNHIRSNAITADKLASNSVETQDIQTNAVTADKLASDSVEAQDLRATAKELFPQLVTAATRKINFGVDTVTGNGTAAVGKVVSHGLGVTPSAVFVMTEFGTRGCGAGTLTSTQFTALFEHIHNSNWSNTITFYWLAIG